jgi:tRNA G18 (ribose-2'-O)-methylase SpoU
MAFVPLRGALLVICGKLFLAHSQAIRIPGLSMPRIPIDDLDDPRIAIYRSLKATNQTRRLDQFVVEGEKLVARLLESRFPPVSLLVTDRHSSAMSATVPDEIPTFIMPHELIDRLIGFPFHRGVLACGQRRQWPPIEEIIARRGDSLFLVICPKLSDPENLGAIARIGDVFGIDAIMAGPECPDPFSRRVLRVSMGSILRVPVIVSEQLAEQARNLQSSFGVLTLAAVTDPAAIPYDQAAPKKRVALILGNEDRGLDQEWLELADQHITIPMRPGAGSLNVAVAAGILIHGLRARKPN